MFHDASWASIAALGRAYRENQLDPVDVVVDVLERARKSMATVNPFITLCDEMALEQARVIAGQFARGADPGPLAGIPVTIKDNIPTRGIRTTFGSSSFAENIPDRDAVGVRRLREAGAVIIGKTSTPEFACRQTTTSDLFGVTRNPIDTSLTPGGSSGGSSASLALDIGLLSLVTDGGGSSRQPAACTGVVGLKGTRGRIPFDLGADAFGTIAQMGLMGRRVSDVRTGLGVLSGYDPADPNSCLPALAGQPREPVAQMYPAGIRIGWRPRLHNERVDPEILTVLEQALHRVSDLGAEVMSLEGDVEPPVEPWRILQSAQWAVRFANQPNLVKSIDPVIAEGMEFALTLGASQLQAAANARTRLYFTVNRWLSDCDVIASPTMARGPLPAEHSGRGPIEIGGLPAGDIREAWAPFLGMFTMTGHPAISINAGFTAKGLPVGLHLAAEWGREMWLLDLAEELESVFRT